MDIGETIDSFKDYFNNRLKNPYFASVVAVWILSNRELVYFLLSSDKSMSFDDKYSWIHEYFKPHSFSVTQLGIIFFEIPGFWVTIVYAFLFGFVTMVVFNLINSSGKAIYKAVSNVSVKMLRWANDPDWVSKKDFDDVNSKYDNAINELNAKRIEHANAHDDRDRYKTRMNEAINSLETTNTLYDKEKIENAEKAKIIAAKNSEMMDYSNLLLEHDKLKVHYAEYGSGTKYVDVTEIVSDQINSFKQINVNDKALGLEEDPAPWCVKDIFIVYEIKGEKFNLTANEYEIIDRTEDGLFSTETEKSKKSQKTITDFNKLLEIFEGDWVLEYRKGNDGQPSVENIVIDSSGRYFVNGYHSFNIISVNINKDEKRESISLVKISVKTQKVHSSENLVRFPNYLYGTDNMEYQLLYHKKGESILWPTIVEQS